MSSQTENHKNHKKLQGTLGEQKYYTTSEASKWQMMPINFIAI